MPTVCRRGGSWPALRSAGPASWSRWPSGPRRAYMHTARRLPAQGNLSTPSTRPLGDARRAPILAGDGWGGCGWVGVGVKDARLRRRSLHQTTEPSERGCCANTNTFASGGPPSVFHPFLVVISTTKNESNFHEAGNDLSQGDPSRHFSSTTSSEEHLGDAQMRRLGRRHRIYQHGPAKSVLCPEL